LKKANAILSLIGIVLCIDHFSCMALLLLEKIAWKDSIIYTGLALAIYMMIHSVYGLYGVIRNYINSKTSHARIYYNANRAYVFQVIMGIVAIVFLIAHIHSIQDFAKDPQLPELIILVIFVAAVSTHIMTGFPRAMVTLGAVRSNRSYYVFMTIGIVVIAVVGIFAISGGITYYLKGGVSF